MTLKALGSGSDTLGQVTRVEMLGSDVQWEAVQDEAGLTLTPKGEVEALKKIADPDLAREVRVFRIRHNKGWFNDDDRGANYLGWKRVANLTTGDYNHDLTISDTPGQVWSAKVTGEHIEVICPREPGAGTIEVFIDGNSMGAVNLASETRIAQARVLKVENLENGEHEVTVRHKSGGPVAVDAIYAFPSRVQEVNSSDLIIETREPKNDHS